MAKLNFPDPTLTQTYIEAGITWTWNATLGVWSSEAGEIPGDGDVSVDVGDTRPSLPSQGDLWFCSSEREEGGGRLYVYYTPNSDEDGQWVDVSQPGVPEASQTLTKQLLMVCISARSTTTPLWEDHFRRSDTHRKGLSQRA